MSKSISPNRSLTPTGTAARLRGFLSEALAKFPWPLVIIEPDGQHYLVGGSREHWCRQPLNQDTSASHGAVSI